MELPDEGDALNKDRLRPSVWKMDAREGLLGGMATGGVWGASEGGAGGEYGGGGGGGEAQDGDGARMDRLNF